MRPLEQESGVWGYVHKFGPMSFTEMSPSNIKVIHSGADNFSSDSKNKRLAMATTTTQTQTQTRTSKREGDISDVFPSLSGKVAPPLPERFSEIKKQRIAGHEEAFKAAWPRLLAGLKREVAELKKKGSDVSSG